MNSATPSQFSISSSPVTSLRSCLCLPKTQDYKFKLSTINPCQNTNNMLWLTTKTISYEMYFLQNQIITLSCISYHLLYCRALTTTIKTCFTVSNSNFYCIRLKTMTEYDSCDIGSSTHPSTANTAAAKCYEELYFLRTTEWHVKSLPCLTLED